MAKDSYASGRAKKTAQKTIASWYQESEIPWGLTDKSPPPAIPEIAKAPVRRKPKAPGATKSTEDPKTELKGSTRCPECDCKVFKKNLGRHLRKCPNALFRRKTEASQKVPIPSTSQPLDRVSPESETGMSIEEEIAKLRGQEAQLDIWLAAVRKRRLILENELRIRSLPR